MSALHQEPADNATLHSGCSITQAAVRPEPRSGERDTGKFPTRFIFQVGELGDAWEKVEAGSKRAAIDEKMNEIIEIPARGHGRKASRRSRRRMEDPRPGEPDETITEKVAADDRSILYHGQWILDPTT